MNKDIKIFISTHKPVDIIENKILIPIQVGTALKGHKKLSNMLHDNTGDNIGELNPKFCELTAQYWAWKNQEADYYGFFHYRRYLSFNPKETKKDNIWGLVNETCINNTTIEKYQLEPTQIEKFIGDNDIILPKLKDAAKMPIPGKNMFDQYALSEQLHERDLKIMLEVLNEKYPEFTPYAETYMSGHKTYFNNMFIMKKEIFNQYCEWLFDILFECEKRIDYTYYSTEAVRTPGHLAERLLNIYILYLKDTRRPKIRETQCIYFEKTDPQPSLMPAFKKNNIPVVFAANNDFVPVFATCLQSILNSSSKENNYDLILLQSDVSADNRTKLLKMIENHKNFSLRFFDASRLIAGYNLKANEHISIETFYRFLIQEAMPDYHKVLYIDCDLIVLQDLAELYKTDVENYMLAATHDPDFLGQINGANPKTMQYVQEKLKMKNPYNYFQAGVLLFNEDRMREAHSLDEWLKFALRGYKYSDQDVLNLYCEGRVKYLDMKWNMIVNHNHERVEKIIVFAPDSIQKEYDVAHASPNIIHYAGFKKPWTDPREDYAELFWEIAKTTPFYENLIFIMSVRAGEFLAEPCQSGEKARPYDYFVKAYQTIVPLNSTIDKKIRKVLRRESPGV